MRGASAGPTVGHKWVRDSVEDEKNDELEDTKITSDDATSHHELLQSDNAIVSQAASLSDEAKPAATSEQASSSLERRGNHKLVMKKDKSDIEGVQSMIKTRDMNLQWLRNAARLWTDYTPNDFYMFDGVDYDPNNPDNLSNSVFELWCNVHEKDIK